MDSEDAVCWYHGKFSRDAAEKLLKSECSEDGSFLVRESSSSSGDYVLSVLHQGDVMHYQIRKHGEDAFFSIDDETTIHGLDTLIEYYQEDCHNLDMKLTSPCKGVAPPHDTRRHGRTNLLHRATIQKNYTIVSELLQCGYRSLEAKNQLGQTAVHLAAKDGVDEILKKLIESKASVNCRDSAGYTPLHYACQSNYPSVVKILIAGGANVQARHTESGIVPLHEAAGNGHVEVIRVLLSFNAPANPRTASNDIPADLAKRYGHYECETLLRESTDLPRHCIQRYFKALCEMSKLMNEKDFLYIDNGPYLSSLEHLVEHYRSMPDGLPGPLTHPIAPVPKPPVPDMPPSLFTGNTLKKTKPKEAATTMAAATTNRNSDTESRDARLSDYSYGATVDNATFSDEASETYLMPLPTAVPAVYHNNQGFISGENLILGEVLGEGEFGAVYEGVYCAPGMGTQEPVAIKTLHESHNAATREEFLREARLMMTLNHHCIVRLIGFSEGPPLLMVQELVAEGSMLAYLIEFKDRVSPSYELKLWASQIACGMTYLEGLRLVHRDLAARNILLATRHQAKISDFGLSRTFGSDDYYRATAGGKWPIKWYAPESYNYGTFSHASDAWSFGITLWEMFSYGEQPYGDRRGTDVIPLVDQGERLSQPEKCPDDIYRVMLRCWSHEPADRPTFKTLLEIFSNDLDYANVRELVASIDIS